jgi:gas vesicle protein
VTTKNSFDQHSRSSGRETQKENQATQSQKERAQAEEKGVVANAKDEERQQAEVTRQVAGTVSTTKRASKRSVRKMRERSVPGKERAEQSNAHGRQPVPKRQFV